MVAMRISPFQSLLTAQRRGTLMSLAVGVGQIGVGISGTVAGLTYTEYGYFGNTVAGAVALLLMALLVQRRLPEPGDRCASSLSPG